MTALYRLIAPDSASGKGKFVIDTYGRKFDPQGAEFVDCSFQDSQMLSANGWTYVASVGVSADRPSKNGPTPGNAVRASAGVIHIDTTLNAVVVYDGHNWHNCLTGAEVV